MIHPGVDLVVKNPGIPYNAPPVVKASELGIEIVTEVEVAWHLAKAPIIGITGSNGKTTTTTWIGHMLDAAGLQPIVAGNIGTPLCAAAEEASPDNRLVLELRSFQLKGTREFRPKVAVLGERIQLIHPGCRVELAHDFFTAASAQRVLPGRCDFVVDAIDRMSHKALLIATCRDRGIPVVSVGGAGGRRDPTKIRTGDIGEAGDELLRQVRKRLRREHQFSPGAHRGITRMGVRCVWSTATWWSTSPPGTRWPG